MAADLSMFWYHTSPGGEDVAWLRRGLDAAPEAAPLARGRALHGLAICLGEQGRTDAAIEASAASYRILRETGDLAWLARSLNTLGGLTRDDGRAAEAQPVMDESIAIRRRLGDPGLPLGVALENRAILALDLGDLDTARRCIDECLGLASGPSDPAVPSAEVILADVAVAAGDLDAAVALLRSAVPALQAHDMRYRLIECLDTYAALAAARDLPDLVATLAAAADRCLADEGSVLVPADARARERRVGAALARLDPGEREEAARTGAALDLDQALGLAAERLH